MGRPQKLSQEEILDQAMELFWQNGSDSVSTRQLESALDLKITAIYRRFNNKDQLLARSIDHYVQTVINPRIQTILDQSTDPLAGLRTFFSTMLASGRDSRSYRGCLLTMTAAHEASNVPEIRQAITAGLNTMEAALTRQVQRARTAGQLNPKIDAASCGKALFMSLQGMLLLSRMNVDGLDKAADTMFENLLGANTI